MLRTFTATALLALSLTAGVFTAAQAESADAIPVAFGDLNLSSPTDAKILADRLQTAALQVCTADNMAPGHVGKMLVQQCMDSSIAIAMSDIEAKLSSNMESTVHANLISVREQVSMN